MSGNHDQPWIVDVEIINPYGICLGEDLPKDDQQPFASWSRSRYEADVSFTSWQDHRNPANFVIGTHVWRIRLGDIIANYVRQAYNLSDDTEINSNNRFPGVSGNTRMQPQYFATKAEALEYADTLGNPEPIGRYRNNDTMFTATWEQVVDGVAVNRSVELDYTGDEVRLYTMNDFINFFALFLGVTPEEIPVEYTLSEYAPEDTPEPSLDCEPYKRVTVFDAGGPSSPIEINIDFTGGSIPGGVVVTAADGDSSIENGDGYITIDDDGRIDIRNSGGVFYLSEYGHAGFYASGDVSLTADAQVQLGVGRTVLTVDSDDFTFRDSTGTVSITADELNRLKALLD